MSYKVLIVDDEVHLAKILQFTLRHAGYEALLAHDGREALEAVKRETPDLILLDLMLPVMDGYKVCNVLKDDQRYASIPVIILSARDLNNEKLESPVRADLFMGKPFNTENLLSEVSRLISERAIL